MKKRKKKEKWSKQIGYFLLKKPFYGSTKVFIDVYYKNELIGNASLPFGYSYKEENNNFFHINDITDYNRTIGRIYFEGKHHRLPKKITNVMLTYNENTILIQKRKVLIEKHKFISLYPITYLNNYYVPASTVDAYINR